MSMDALSSQALKSLVEEMLPKLQAELEALHGKDAGERESSDTLEFSLGESIELLQIVHAWTGKGEHSIAAGDELQGDEASTLLEEASGDFESEDDSLISDMENDDSPLGDSLSNKEAGEQADEEEMSDDEAALMMNQVSQDEAEAAMMAPPEEISPDDAAMIASDEEDQMSDDEAAAMLANMDGGGDPTSAPSAGGGDEEMSDDEAAAMLANMDGGGDPAPDPSAGGGDDEMSDDEAAAMLAQMDGGGDPPPAPSAGGDDEMSDDEAAAMLAQMDGGGGGDSAPAEDMSAEDEASALLAKLGGDDEDEEDIPQAQAPAAAPSGGGDDISGYTVTEIEEWEANDFQTDPDMVNDFNVNSDEIMETLDEQILKLEQDPSSTEIIEEIFRAAHTLKGAAGMFGFKGLERVMHRMENLFDLVRKGKLTPTGDIVDVMFEGLDIIRDLLEACKEGKPCGVKTGEIVVRLEMLADGKTPPGMTKSSESSGASSEADAPAASGDGGGGGGGGGGDKKATEDKKKEQSTIRVDLNRLDALVNLVGELVIDRTRFVTIEEELRTNYPDVKLSGNISETVQLFGRHMNEIQDIIMKVRMVPIGNAFNKYPRIIRDLAKQLGKKINLHISGESAELDKTLVEQIGDPLIHLIRNSCDHGVEAPEVRVEAGKPEAGNIWLSAHQEGNHIIITIEDDGKGIPVDIIRRKGIEKGLISEDDKLSDREIFNLIFEPGFSTAEQITNVSGRGVGMDVVKKQIMKLKGLVEIDSEMGKGTTTTIRLPLTLAIVQSLLVRSKEEIFAIPLSSVIESIRIEPEEIQKVGEAEVIKLRDKVLPLMHLNQQLLLEEKKSSIVQYIHDAKFEGAPTKTLRKGEKYFVVVVGQPDRPFGILVDQLLNQQEMVIKSMGRVMKDIPCVAGGAVLGNGEVVLVLDIPDLEQSFTSKARIAA